MLYKGNMRHHSTVTRRSPLFSGRIPARFWLFFLLLAGAAIPAPLASAQAPYPLPPPDETAARLSELRFSGYFELPAYEEMADACSEKIDPENPPKVDCTSAIRNMLSREKYFDQIRRLRFLLGMREFEGGDLDAARKTLSAIDGGYALLDDYVQYYLGEIAYQKKEWELARDHFRRIPTDSRLSLQARFKSAFCLSALKSPEAVAELEPLVSEYPKHFHGVQARFELAEALRATDRARAEELYLDVRRLQPRAGYGKQAETRMKQLRMKTPDRAGLTRLRIAQAETLFEQFQYRKASKLLEDLRAEFSESDRSAIHGEWLFTLGQAYFKRRSYTQAIAHFERVAKTKASKDIQGRALTHIADAYLRKGREADAIRTLAEFFKKYPEHGQACKATYLQGKGHMELEHLPRAIEAFERLATAFPDCDYTETGRWYTAWLNYRLKRFDPAVKSLKNIATGTKSRFEKERALYWLGRIAADKRENDQAVSIWTRLAAHFPLGYYSGLAVQRLEERNQPIPEAYREREDLRQTPLRADLDLDVRGYIANHHFRKGLELLKLGRRTEAGREFRAMEKQFPDDDVPKILSATLYHLADQIPRSIYLFRTRLDSFADRYPKEGNRSLWKMAYPLVYFDLAERYCRQVGLDPFLLMALMREESSFQADVRSYANALGLTQIIRSTGRVIASQLGERNFRFEDLMNPETAIRFGSFHIEELVRKFKGNHALAIGSYNAGETAIRRWVRADPDVDMDVFVESIPYTQTRRYTRRVLKSYGIYRHLYSRDLVGFNLWKTPMERNPGPAKAESGVLGESGPKEAQSPQRPD